MNTEFIITFSKEFRYFVESKCKSNKKLKKDFFSYRFNCELLVFENGLSLISLILISMKTLSLK
jgi:hypothetical protein